jgi:hypothetical protein
MVQDWHWIGLIIAYYGLLIALSTLLRDAVYIPLKKSGVLEIRNRVRWLWLTIFLLAQIVICYSILYLAYGDEFEKAINGPLTALYVSLLTFTTLGYGDIYPKASIGQLIVVSQLVFFVLWIGVKLPVAINAIRVQSTTQK